MLEDIVRAANDAEHLDQVRRGHGMRAKILSDRRADPFAVRRHHADQRRQPLAPIRDDWTAIRGEGGALGREGTVEIGDRLGILA